MRKAAALEVVWLRPAPCRVLACRALPPFREQRHGKSTVNSLVPPNRKGHVHGYLVL